MDTKKTIYPGVYARNAELSVVWRTGDAYAEMGDDISLNRYYAYLAINLAIARLDGDTSTSIYDFVKRSIREAQRLKDQDEENPES